MNSDLIPIIFHLSGSPTNSDKNNLLKKIKLLYPSYSPEIITAPFQLKLKVPNNEWNWKEIYTTLENEKVLIISEEITLPVLEMSCAACATSVEKVLSNQPGVLQAEVHYAASKAIIKYLPDLTTPEDWNIPITKAGYELITQDLGKSRKTLEEKQLDQFHRLQNRMIWAIGLSVPVVIMGMLFMHTPYMGLWMGVFTCGVLLGPGRLFFQHAYSQMLQKTANMDTLVALSTGVAFIYSVYQLAISGWINPTPVWFEAAAATQAIVLLGKWLEARTRYKTTLSLRNWSEVTVPIVTRINANQQTEIIAYDQVKIGDIVQVKPGEKIPVDGRVYQGFSIVDEQLITGESLPIHKSVGDKVLAGTLNQQGVLIIEVIKAGQGTYLAQMIRQVEGALLSKPPIQRRVDTLSKIFVPIVIGIATLSLLLWVVLGGELGLQNGVRAFITVLVIACPCALGLATPTALLGGMGWAAKSGILIRDAESLENLRNVSVVIFDKTGTLTTGHPSVSRIHWASSAEGSQSILSQLEFDSGHPLGLAVAQYLEPYIPVTWDSFENIPGKGVVAVYQGIEYRAGNLNWLAEEGINSILKGNNLNLKNANSTATIIGFSKNKELLALIEITDSIRAESKNAIQALVAQGLAVYLLTGDGEEPAKVVAEACGILNYKANFSPLDKSKFIAERQAEGHKVLMVGDGINDGPALALAEVSIAMGGGSDLAHQAAEIILQKEDLNNIPLALNIARKTWNILQQNLFWAFIYNLLFIPLAAGLGEVFNGPTLNPMMASAAMSLSSISVVLNSLRLKN